MNKKIVHSKLSKAFDTMGDFYTDNPVMRTLATIAGLFPPISVLDEAATSMWTRAKQKRFEALLSELNEGRQYITEALVKEELFLYAFQAVTRATVLTYQQEKIHLFARLLINACRYKKLDSNEFEDNLKILDELSIHEYKFLLLFREHEKQLEKKAQKEPGDHHRNPQWSLLAADAENQLGIPSEDLGSALTRLARTGLYQPAVSFVSNDTLGSGSTTPKLDKFLRWVIDENNDLHK